MKKFTFKKNKIQVPEHLFPEFHPVRVAWYPRIYTLHVPTEGNLQIKVEKQ